MGNTHAAMVSRLAVSVVDKMAMMTAARSASVIALANDVVSMGFRTSIQSSD